MKLHKLIKKTEDIIVMATECSVGVIDKEGYPHVSTRSAIMPQSMLYCYFSTNKSGNLAELIKTNGKSSVCIRHENNNITLIGESKIVTDKKIKKTLWQDWFIHHYEGGVEDKEYTIIRFVTKKVSLWVDRQTAKFDIKDVIKPQSSCGLFCSTCEYKEPNSCGGCISTKGNPFYGECRIAKCAREKGYIHCGQCDIMPCDMLYGFSNDDKEHCDNPKGARINVLEMWRKAESMKE